MSNQETNQKQIQFPAQQELKQMTRAPPRRKENESY